MTRFCALAVALTLLASAPMRGQPQALRKLQAVALPGVRGRIDHLAYDAARARLLVSALGNNTVEVVDTARGTHLRSLLAFHEPQGIAVVPDFGAVAIANGGTGTLQLIDAADFRIRWTTAIGDDADNVRYDAGAKRLLVAAVGGIFEVDPATGRVTRRLAIDGHPESFQLEGPGPRLFANLPGGSQIVVGDRTSMTVVRRFGTGTCRSNYPMALDETMSRVIVGCRSPASVEVFDLTSGRTTGSAPSVGDTDDLFYDAALRQVYVIGGEGFVDVLSRDGDTLRRVQRSPTRAGARTGLWVPEVRRLYVAAPNRGSEAAEIQVFEAVRD